MKQLRGRRALVTGAASGIGKALALELAREGMDLCLVDVNEAGLDAVCEEVRNLGVDAVAHVCDLTRREELVALTGRVLAEWGGVDLLVNNAGIAYYGPTHAMTAEQWDRMLNVNLLAPIHLTQALLPSLLAREDAHVVNMCSISGLVAGGRFNAYHTTKFGLVGFTLALRAEYCRKGLGVTAMCPGPARTNLYTSCASPKKGPVPQPPAWICCTPETIARRTMRAIHRNRRMVLISPLAHLLYNLNRFVPGVIDFLNTFSRKRLPWGKAKSAAAVRPTAAQDSPHPVTRRAA
jgi:short-subunit dehydrogenase